MITADVRNKSILGIESHVKDNGPSEPDVASSHMKNAILNGVKIGRF